MVSGEIKPVLTWLVEIDGVKINVDCIKDLIGVISEAEQSKTGSLWIGKDDGPRPLWQRLLGLRNYINALLTVEWDGESASLIFFDENASEYRALGSNENASKNNVNRERITHGELQAVASDECIDRARAFLAINEFIETGSRPIWLSYRFVK